MTKEIELINKTILLVEDETKIRELNTSIISLLVGNVIQSIDGLDGLKKFSQNQNIDLLIVDINMPNMDGITMCKTIRELNHNIPIIITSGYDESTYKDEIEQYSISKYLRKPIDSYKLLDSIKEILLK